MAVRIDASGDYLRRTANLPAINSFSMCCWFYYTASMSAWAYVLGMEDAAESSGNWCLLGLDGSNNFHITNFTGYSFFASNPATGAWHFVALTGDATTITGYHRTAAGVWQTPVTLPLITFTPAALWFGNDSYSERINGRIAAMKVWSATLTQAEIELEAATIRPHRFSNLNLWCPGFPGAGERSRDYSGNGYNLTEGGTLTDEDGPPVSYGASVWVLPFVEVGGGTTYNMTFSATGVSATANDADLPVLRSLAATATATTATTDAATLNTATVFSLALAAQAATTTGDTATAAILRSLAVDAAPATNTAPAGALALLKALALAAQATTVTSARYGIRFYGNGTGQIDRLRIELDNPSDPPIDVGAGDFCYEFWMRCALADNATTATDEDARYSNIILDRDIWGHERGWVLGVTRNAGNTALVACFGVAGAGLSWATIFGVSNVGDGRWHHIALTRSTSTVRLFVDGVQEATGTYSGDLSYPNGVRPSSGQDNHYLVIGTEKHDVGFGYNGEFAAFRVSDIARYTSGFTPPQVVGIDGDTMALFLFEEQTGTTAYDTSGLPGAENAALLVGGSPSGPVWTAGGTASIVLVKAATLAATIGTASPDADLAVLRSLTGNAAGVTTTNTAVLAVLRSLTGSATALTTTNTAALAVLRILTQAATTGTATGDVDLAVLRALAQAATGATDTAAVDLAVLRTLAQAVIAASNTAGASAAVLRPLAGNAVAATMTPDSVTLNLAAILALAMSASGGTATNTAMLAVLRSLAGSATVTTNTEASDLAVLRNFTAAATGVTATNTAMLAVLRVLAQAATTGTATPDDVTLNLTAVIALALAAQGGTATNTAVLAVLRSATATAQGGTDTASATLAVLRSLISGATTGSAAPDTVTLNLAAILALALAAMTGTATPDAGLAVLRSLTGQATGASNTAGAILTALRSLTSDAQVGSVTEAAELAVLRDAYHGAVAGTATSDAVDFRTVAIIGLLRLIVTGALQPSVAASALRPTITASGRRPSIESGE